MKRRISGDHFQALQNYQFLWVPAWPTIDTAHGANKDVLYRNGHAEAERIVEILITMVGRNYTSELAQNLLAEIGLRLIYKPELLMGTRCVFDTWWKLY